MSFFSQMLFGRKSEPAPESRGGSAAVRPPPAVGGHRAAGGNTSSATKTIQTIRQTEETLLKKEELLEKEILALKVEAQGLLANGQKHRALLLFKKAKAKEESLAKTVAAGVDQLSRMGDALEQAKIQKEILGAVQMGTEALKKEGVSGEDVADAMDALEEQVSNVKDVSDALAANNGGSDVSDEELMREMAEFEAPRAAAAPAVPAVAAAAPAAPAAAAAAVGVNLPVAPTGAIRAPASASGMSSEDERQLAELSAWQNN